MGTCATDAPTRTCAPMCSPTDAKIHKQVSFRRGASWRTAEDIQAAERAQAAYLDEVVQDKLVEDCLVEMVHVRAHVCVCVAATAAKARGFELLEGAMKLTHTRTHRE